MEKMVNCTFELKTRDNCDFGYRNTNPRRMCQSNCLYSTFSRSFKENIQIQKESIKCLVIQNVNAAGTLVFFGASHL